MQVADLQEVREAHQDLVGVPELSEEVACALAHCEATCLTGDGGGERNNRKEVALFANLDLAEQRWSAVAFHCHVEQDDVRV